MISDRLKEVRVLLGYGDKQKEFAEILDMKQGSYSDVERGKTKSISKKMVRNLYTKFGISQDYLLYGKLPILLNNEDGGEASTPPTTCVAKDLTHFLSMVDIKDKQIGELVSQQGELIQQQKTLIDIIASLISQK